MKLDVIYNEDCLEGMKLIPSKSIDMILCDLPYGTTKNKWDSVIDLNVLWQHYERIIKDNGAIVLFSQMPFSAELVHSNLKLFRYEWIWKKDNSTGFLNAKKMPLKIHENILIFYKKLPVYNPQMRVGFKPYQAKQGRHSSNYGDYEQGFMTKSDGSRFPIDVIEFNKDIGLHPTQKPVKLFSYLIKTYTNENAIILDNCMGSGTTAIACLETNRHYIGYELDSEYFKIAQNRISEFKSQNFLI